MDELDGSGDSVDLDYSLYINALLLTNFDTIFYAECIEPTTLKTLKYLDLNFFFTLTILYVLTLDDEVLVTPLIVLLTSNEEKFDVVRETIKQLWAQNDFNKYLILISFGYDAASTSDQVSFAYDFTTSYYKY